MFDGGMSHLLVICTLSSLHIRLVSLLVPSRKFLKLFDVQIKENSSGWLVGDKVTIADLNLYSLAETLRSGFMKGIPADLIDKYPNLVAHEAKVKTIPEVQSWYTKYPPLYSTFDFEP